MSRDRDSTAYLCPCSSVRSSSLLKNKNNNPISNLNFLFCNMCLVILPFMFESGAVFSTTAHYIVVDGNKIIAYLQAEINSHSASPCPFLLLSQPNSMGLHWISLSQCLFYHGAQNHTLYSKWNLSKVLNRGKRVAGCPC